MAWLRRLLLLIFLTLSSAYVLIFCLRNSTKVNIDFFFIQLNQVRIELVIVSAFILGGLFGLLSATGLLYQMRKKYRLALRKTHQQLAQLKD